MAQKTHALLPLPAAMLDQIQPDSNGGTPAQGTNLVSAGLTITATFDTSITTDPNAAAIEGAINSAIAIVQSRFADPITVNIKFTEGGGLASSSSWFETVSYATFLAALKGDAKTADDATATSLLPSASANPVNGQTTINVKTANLKAVGLPTSPTGDGFDGTISINTTRTSPGSPGSTLAYSLQAAVLHEIDEVLGLGSSLPDVPSGTIFPEDLYRYSVANTRTFTTTDSRTSGVFAYFSIDGTNALSEFDNQNDGGDFGDWQSNPLRSGMAPKVQDAFGTPGANPPLGVELTALDVIGYDRVFTGPTMALDRTSLVFAGVNNGAKFISMTGSQTVRMTQTGSGTITWTATPSQPWIQVSPASGSGTTTLTISAAFAPGLSSTQTGTVTLALTNAGNSVGPITVTLNSIVNGTSQPPFGSFDTPTNGSTGVVGSIPVTGWALDDVQVTRVTICRDPVPGENAPPTGNCAGNAKIYIGDAVFVDGARLDVQAANPTAPLNSRGGWGYLLLTNVLPSQGNGTFNLEAYAFDADGHVALLATRTITCANASSTAPFGAIDTPAQGAVVSGSAFANFGWVLAKGGYADPPHGGTVQVFVDGTVVGVPSGWTSRSDLTATFTPSSSYPGLNSALGVYGLDTTKLSNGVHTIFWIATGAGGIGAAGIGSRFFTVSNGTASAAPASGVAPSRTSAVIAAAPTLHVPTSAMTPVASLDSEVAAAPVDLSEVEGRRGYDLDAALQTYRPSSGRLDVQAEELDRIELHLSRTSNHQYSGYLHTPSGLRPLPVGSTLNASTGAFTWMAGIGFYGAYDLTFVRWSGGTAVARQDVRITLNPKGSNRVGPQTIIDAPGENVNVGSPFYVGGWAADLDSAVDSGVSTVHMWAYPVDANGHRLDPIFLGPASYGGARPDVAAVYGGRFGDSGYGLIVSTLPPGTYDIAVFAYSTVLNTFAPAKLVRVTVR